MCFVLSLDLAFSIDFSDRLKLNQKHYIASTDSKLYEDKLPVFFNLSFKKDSTVHLISNVQNTLSLDRPNVKAGFLVFGGLKHYSFLFESSFSNDFYKLANLGMSYSRNNISASINNAFFQFDLKNIYLRLGKSSNWWNQSFSRSIIQSGLYPSFNHILFRYKIANFQFELLNGQLGSSKTQEGNRIKRFMAGTRFRFNIKNKTLITVGQQIIYTGVNRGVEISYLNPFIPYFFSGLEDEEDGFPFDNDNTILFIDFKHEVNLNMSLFAELLVDDIQIDNTGLDHAFGYKIGMNKMFLL